MRTRSILSRRRDGTTLPVDPFKALRIQGRELHAVDGPLLGRHEKHHWHVRGVG